MKKKHLLSGIAFSTLALAQAGLISADEVVPVDPSAPSTEVVTPAAPSTPGITEDEVQPAPTTPADETPAQPSPVDPTTPSTDVPAPSTEQEKENAGDNVGETKPSQADQTTDQGKDTAANVDHLPAEQAQTTQQANQQGASQVGTISTATGQVVQNVTPNAPVQTNTGASIVSTQNGQVVLQDGSIVSPEAIGAVANTDKTITVTKEDGTKITLPETGASASILSVVGTMLLIGLRFIVKKEV